MRSSVPLGRIAGVRFDVNLSVLVFVAILIVELAYGRFPLVLPGRSTGAYLVAAAIATVLFLASVLAHELAHAVLARRNGIRVESITLWLLGGVAQLKGEPRSPDADLRIAAAGPLTSLALGVVFGAGASGLLLAGAHGLPVAVFAYLAGVNVILAIFNLVPAAPLDGGRVLRAVLWLIWRDRPRAPSLRPAPDASSATYWSFSASFRSPPAPASPDSGSC
jgi:Zn-dependent protease